MTGVPVRDSRARLIGFLWAAITVAIFSGWFIVTRFGVTHELRVWDVTALRFGIGALVLSPVLFLGRNRLPRGAWLEGLLFAVLWGAPFVLLVALGLQLTSAAQAASIAPTMMPVFAGLLGWLLLREKVARLRLLGYAAIVAGVIGLVFASSTALGPPDPLGVGAVIFAAGMWAIYTLRFRRSGLSALQSAALICFWSAVLFVPVYLIFGLSRLDHASLQELIFQGSYQGVLMSAVAIVTFNRAVAILGPGAATAIIALIPATTTGLAVPILGEIPSPLARVAIAVIVIGVMLAAWPPPARA